MFVKGINVLAASLLAAILNEFISWLLIYRTEEYQRLKGTLTRTEKKLESIRNTAVKNDKTKKKKERRQEDQMKARMRELSSIRLKTTIVTGALLFVFYQVLTSMYDGQPVAKLPFRPIPLIAKITHRGLPGDDMTEASVVKWTLSSATHRGAMNEGVLLQLTFIYVLCSASLRTIVGKVFNFGLSKKMNAIMNENPWAKYLKEEEQKTS